MKIFSSKKVFGSASAVALLCLGGLFSTPARQVTVNISDSANDFSFFPAVTNISTGDQVVWVWKSVGSLFVHSTTDTNVWDSQLQPSPFSFTNTFNSAGTFHYLCKKHFAMGMTGAVVVAAAFLPPTLAITNPLAGAVFAAPASVTIQAAVTNGSGTVTNVQFLVASGVLTNETAPPYSATTNNLAANSYTLSAIATDNNGLKATNTATISVVTPVPVVISPPLRPNGSNIQFSYTANAGLGYIVQRSTNLSSASWITLATNTAADSQVNFSDTNVTANPGFYRVGRLPNP